MRADPAPAITQLTLRLTAADREAFRRAAVVIAGPSGAAHLRPTAILRVALTALVAGGVAA